MEYLLIGDSDDSIDDLKEEEAECNAEQHSRDESSGIGRLISRAEELDAAVGNHRQHPEERRSRGEPIAHEKQEDDGNLSDENARAPRT